MNTEDQSEFSRQVGVKEKRKLKAKRHARRSVWFGFSMFGLVGWSVVVPTLLGTLLGIWLDKRYPGTHSWTLTLLITGLALGSMNAWYWVNKESKEIQNDQEEDKEEKHE